MTLSIDDTPLEVVVRRPVFVRFRFATSPLRHSVPWQTKRERKKWPMRRYRLRRDRWWYKHAASRTDRKIPASTTYLSGIGGVESMRIDAVRDASMCSLAPRS